MTVPINVIFSHLQVRACRFNCLCSAAWKTLVNAEHSLTLTPQKKTRVRIWLYEDARLQIEGQIIGFDEYMNVVLDEAVELDSKKNARQEVGRILLKGDSITLLQEAQPVRPAQE